jgi:CubicO group peptidase (beta-lactamase class C family)
MKFSTITNEISKAVANSVAADVIVMLADAHSVRYAHRAHSPAAANTSEGVEPIFWFGSKTKAIVATAALQLVDRGLVRLDEPVSRFLPALAQPQVLEGFDDEGEPLLRPARGEITLRMLLSHTSGLAYDIFNPDMARFMAQRQIPNIVACRNVSLNVPLVSDPGADFV